jgi:RNA polymerase sigma factor (sigma-70 family)
MASNAARIMACAMRSAVKAARPELSDQELLRQFADGDQQAFAILVGRHADMVLGVCRRVLPTLQDAEDACQATFLVLTRKAGNGRWQKSVANWLFTTARRIASTARRAAVRRSQRERKAARREAVCLDQMSGREAFAALDEELGKLAAIYREPLVLCYLEGLTRDEAAARLRVPVATLKSQLDRGRKKLSDALIRRGCGLGAGLFALTLTSPARASSPRLIEAILASGSPPAAVAALAKGGIMNSLMKKALSALIAVVSLTAFGITMAAVGGAVESPTTRQITSIAAKASLLADSPKTTKPAPDPKEIPVSGHVLGLDGKPVAGAELLLASHGKKPEKLGTSDERGGFTVTLSRADRSVMLLARAPGAGCDFISGGTLRKTQKVELRLVKDHAIRGRVVDTQGKPVGGATVSVQHISGYADNSLDSFLVRWKQRNPIQDWLLPSGVKEVRGDAILPAATTDKAGRFTISGAGSERVVSLHVRGPGIASAKILVVNRPGFTPEPYNKATVENHKAKMPLARNFPLLMVWGPDLTFVAQAEKPIRGVVKDRDTGKPRAGARVVLSQHGEGSGELFLEATTDAQGRYQIHGARKSVKGYFVTVLGSGYLVPPRTMSNNWNHLGWIRVLVDAESGYLPWQATSPDSPGYDPLTIDIKVCKGVTVTGRMIDGATGKSLRGFVRVDALAGNPFAKDYPGFSNTGSLYPTADDGTFRVVTIPGPVLLMGDAWSPEKGLMEATMSRFHYKLGVPDPKHPRYFEKSGLGVFSYRTLGNFGGILDAHFAKVLEIKPGSGTLKQDVVLEPASALPVKIVDQNDRPVRGAWITGMSFQNWHQPIKIDKDTCSAYQLEPGKPRLLVVYDAVGKRYGTLRLKGDEKESAIVKLAPGGRVKGRLVDEDGQPLRGAVVRLTYQERPAEEIHLFVYRAKSIQTDADGKFSAEGVPGVKFSLSASRGDRTYRPAKPIDESVAPGKSLDLGDVKVNPNA